MRAHALALRRLFGLTTEQIVINCYVHSAFFTHHSQNEKRLSTQNKRREDDCFHFRSASEAPTYQVLSPFQLLQMHTTIKWSMWSCSASQQCCSSGPFLCRVSYPGSVVRVHCVSRPDVVLMRAVATALQAV